MRERSARTDELYNDEKTPVIVIKKIRDLILDETFKPRDWLPESELGERFGVTIVTLSSVCELSLQAIQSKSWALRNCSERESPRSSQ
jgi:hypothetical protein